MAVHQYHWGESAAILKVDSVWLNCLTLQGNMRNKVYAAGSSSLAISQLTVDYGFDCPIMRLVSDRRLSVPNSFRGEPNERT